MRMNFVKVARLLICDTEPYNAPKNGKWDAFWGVRFDQKQTLQRTP
jgi:hypothetical protein